MNSCWHVNVNVQPFQVGNSISFCCIPPPSLLACLAVYSFSLNWWPMAICPGKGGLDTRRQGPCLTWKQVGWGTWLGQTALSPFRLYNLNKVRFHLVYVSPCVSTESTLVGPHKAPSFLLFVLLFLLFWLLFLLFWLLYGGFLCHTSLCVHGRVHVPPWGVSPIWLSWDSSDRAELGSSKCRHQDPFCLPPHTSLEDVPCMIAGWN